ncbi:MAG: response regulator [Luteitalea sp.]|nr:response regulator [Luteitalea sp.]
MPTDAVTLPSPPHGFRHHAAESAVAGQKVVIVNGSAAMLGVLDAALDAGHYDIVFVESNEHAYSQIKRVQPNLVILCVRIDDLDGFHVLSMLKLDHDTRNIPVLTYATEFDGEQGEGEQEGTPELQMFATRQIVQRMN